MLQFQLLKFLIKPPFFRQPFHHGQRAGDDTHPALNDGPKDDLAGLIQVVVLRTISIGVRRPNYRSDRGSVSKLVSL